MSALRGTPAGVFELRRSSSFRGPQSITQDYVSEKNFEKTPNGEGSPTETDYEEEEVDESVREDMNKLEDTFPGISDRFRLVNRIGEGIFTHSDLILS